MKATLKTEKYHHGDLKNACILAGISIVENEGVHSLSLRKVARIVGVSHNAPLRTFRSKEDLIVAITIRVFDEIVGELAEVIESSKNDPEKDFYNLCNVFFQYAINHREKYRLVAGYAIEESQNYPELIFKASESFVLIHNMLEDYKRKGLIHVEDSQKMTILSISMIHGYCSLVIEGKLNLLDQTLQQEEDYLKFMVSQLVNLMNLK